MIFHRSNARVAVLAPGDRWSGTSEGRVVFARRVLDIVLKVLITFAAALAVLAFASHFQLSQAQEIEQEMGTEVPAETEAPAQQHADHNHPPEDAWIHDRFYSTWMMPDRPGISCCNKQDCYPTEVRYRDGYWEAKRRDDGRFIRVPWSKVEQRRDNPDSRNHVCMPSARVSPEGEVYCFALGGGM